MVDLAGVFRKVVDLLRKNNVDYLVIGGIASSILGYPRFTQDVDICIFIKRKKVKEFLKMARTAGFMCDEKAVFARIRETGTFQIQYDKLHVDFLIASTKFEESALRRKKRIKIYNTHADFPTPEDLILFKIIPARNIDLADIENIAIRHKGNLDKKYLLNWATKLADTAQDMRIYEDVKKLLD